MTRCKLENRTVYRLSEDEREALEQSAADLREGRFATDEEVPAIFEEYREGAD